MRNGIFSPFDPPLEPPDDYWMGEEDEFEEEDFYDESAGDWGDSVAPRENESGEEESEEDLDGYLF